MLLEPDGSSHKNASQPGVLVSWYITPDIFLGTLCPIKPWRHVEACFLTSLNYTSFAHRSGWAWIRWPSRRAAQGWTNTIQQQTKTTITTMNKQQLLYNLAGKRWPKSSWTSAGPQVLAAPLQLRPELPPAAPSRRPGGPAARHGRRAARGGRGRRNSCGLFWKNIGTFFFRFGFDL